MAPSKAAAATSPYAKDERVLCFHHEMLYEAKILDVRKTDEKDGDHHSWQYKIHYKGWKNTVGSLEIVVLAELIDFPVSAHPEARPESLPKWESTCPHLFISKAALNLPA